MVSNLSKSPVVRAIGHRYGLIIFIALIGINTGILNMLTNQVVGATAKNIQVKDDTTSAVSVETVVDTAESADNTINLPVNEDKATITTYIVKSGDTLGSIAEQFHISTNTIRWANDLGKSSKIKIGDKLTILPVSGVRYTVKKGDTISGIAKKFGADSNEIITSNELEHGAAIKVDTELIIPDAEPLQVKTPTPAKQVSPQKEQTSKTNTSTEPVAKKEKSDSSRTESSFATPIDGAVLTQGKHGTNAVDFGAPIGTTIFAAADGVVILAKGNGAYNGGYGNYIVIDHPNGTQTLYAHLSKVSVAVGDTVAKGEIIGKSGNTGRSTGPHLHFEVRGGSNPFVKNKVGTRY